MLPDDVLRLGSPLLNWSILDFLSSLPPISSVAAVLSLSRSLSLSLSRSRELAPCPCALRERGPGWLSSVRWAESLEGERSRREAAQLWLLPMLLLRCCLWSACCGLRNMCCGSNGCSGCSGSACNAMGGSGSNGARGGFRRGSRRSGARSGKASLRSGTSSSDQSLKLVSILSGVAIAWPESSARWEGKSSLLIGGGV